MTEPVPDVVTLHLWRLPSHRVTAAMIRIALDRSAIRREPGVRFAKLFGTGSTAFTAAGSNLRRWGLLVSWSAASAAAAFEQSAPIRRWSRLVDETWRAELRPLASRGQWARAEPFGTPPAAHWDGPVAAVTRARLALGRGRQFRAVSPLVAADLADRPGLKFAVGIGEAPVAVKGTISLWESVQAVRAFAYAGAAHTAAMLRASTEGWYAEELFARFGVLCAAGTIDGRDPLR